MNARKKIVLIGSGNVATQLGLALLKSHHKIVQVYSKRKPHAEKLAGLLDCDYTISPKKINATADLYIVAVNDDAIAKIAKDLKLSNQIVAHTSGSVTINILKNVSKNYGVFYPLQTLSKDKNLDFTDIPICLEANNDSTLSVLKLIAKSISNNVQEINSAQRKIIHLAAVFASNFSNHLFGIAEGILEKNKLSLDLLLPLIEETVNKIKYAPPAQMQTGPAIRGDKKIMKEHLQLLADSQQLQKMYSSMSRSIINSSKQGKI